jgi:hypothetical protein
MTLKTLSLATALLTLSAGAFAQTMTSPASPGQQNLPAYQNYYDHDSAAQKNQNGQVQQAPKTTDSVNSQNKSN